ncbi:MAG: tape measure protein [Paenisporosarcina sp.]
MPSVDDRIVRMEFDNAAFERKLDTTLTSLGKLEKSLNFEGAGKGLSDINSAIGKVHFGSITDGIENVSRKFIALSTIAITALASITTKAIETGIQFTKALSLDPIIDGFGEYETQLNSVQTILANTASKGTTLDQVNEALQQLNEYSDQTIYNFGQMARNIGTFTAAGVDLDTSVGAIKGIANLAAMSGSSSEQASTAMYQLSQAIASGSVKLMDWNSVVNAGMGGEAFQTALFETGKAMGTLNDVPLDQSLKEWTDSGNSFRDSLKTGWITADVLTTTLAGFTGDLTEEMLIAKGYSQAQATNIMKTAAIAKAAATEVKTFSQLVGTVKEAVGTGWADSFKIVIGNFTEAKELWTGVNNSIGAFVKSNADARNALLQGWKDLGGRTLLIDSLKTAFTNLGEVLQPIQDAFREVFPPVTAERLFELTQKFSEFANALKPSEQTVNNLKSIFKGLFSILDTGWEIIKQGVGFITDLIGSFTGVGSGKILDFIAHLGEFATALNDILVEGGGIQDFFDMLRRFVADPLPYLQDLKENLLNLFTGFNPELAGEIGDGFERLGQRFETLKSIFEKAKDLWGPFSDALGKVGEVLDQVWDVIRIWFEELGDKIAAVMGPGDFDAAVDALNVGLLGGIAALLAKFIKEGFSFDIGSGLFDKIGKSFEELTGVLSAMQTSIKADALLKIAGAIALLTASVVVLSLIDSAALTKSLTAMAVGFGELMASFAILTKLSAGPKGAASLAILSTSLVAISAAILILAAAAAVMAAIDAEDLARGLAGLTTMLATMTTVAIILSKNSGSLIGAGIGMIAIAVAINILAGAVKLFSMMSWTDIGKGMAAVAGGLLIIAGAMRLMPGNMALQGVGLMLVATSLSILAGSIKLFSMMSWEEMGKGFGAVAAGLLIIAGAMHLMPSNLPITAAGLLLVSIAMNFMAKAMGEMGQMSWDEIGRGLAVLAGSLLILAVATQAMSGSIVGAIAIGIVSASLLLLAKVLKEFGKIKFSDLLRGLIGIAAALAVLGIAAMLLQPALGPMMLLGAALVLIGGGFALFGIGASLVAEAFERLAEAGEAGSKALVKSMEAIGRALPALLKGLAEGLLELIQVFVDAAPVLVKGLGVVLEHLIDTLITLVPKFGELIVTIIDTMLTIFKTYVPTIIEAGIFLLTSLLQGIRNNIGQVATLVLEIVVEFINALTANIGPIITAGVDLLIAFIKGITDNVDKIVTAVGELITSFIGAAAGLQQQLIDAGVDLLVDFIQGITDNLSKITTAVGTLISTFVTDVGNQATKIAKAGTDALVAFLKGMTDNVAKITTAVGTLITKFITSVSGEAQRLITAGANAIVDFVEGLGKNALKIVAAGVRVVLEFLSGISKNTLMLVNKGAEILIDFLNGLADAIERHTPQIQAAGKRIALAVADGFTFGMASKAKSMASSVTNAVGGAIGAGASLLGIGSPSKVFYEMGQWSAIGFSNAFNDDKTIEKSAVGLVERTTKIFNDVIPKITESLGNVSEFNPTITPVLDLTNVETEARKISGYIQTANTLTPAFSTYQARTIASSTNAQQDDTVVKPLAGTGEVKFEQNIYAPAQLSTGDIYRQTRNQITMAKEELSIP